MKASKGLLSICAALLVCISAHVWALETDVEFTDELLMPDGEYYEATVPDTLDIAERAKLSVHGLTEFLNPKLNYAPPGHAFFNTDPPFLFHSGAGCWGKIMDALIMTRLMSGSDKNLDIQRKSINGMLETNRIWVRGMMAFMSLYEQSPDPQLRDLIERFGEIMMSKAEEKGQFVTYRDEPPENQDQKFGVRGYGWETFINGSMLRGLSMWLDETGDPEYREHAKKLKNFILQDKFWQPEAAPKAVVGSDHGQFMGHHHSFLAALMGLLRYAEATGDRQIMQFVRDGYEYFRTFGIAQIGLFAETCSTGDMTFLAIKMSEMGIGDYWDDADRYLRNQLAELQITDKEKIKRAAEADPILVRYDPNGPDVIQAPLSEAEETYELDPILDSTEDVYDRTLGDYLSCCSHPTHIPKHQFLFTICCSGNATSALYYAWSAAIREKDDDVQINLLINRASPWLDLESYLPYEGKAVIRNKTARSVSVRIPDWASMDEVECTVNGKPVGAVQVGRYVVIGSVKPEDLLKIEFPMVEHTETYTLKWKKEDFWFEGTNPGSNWKPKDNPDEFTFHFKGNTVVDVEPEYTGDEYKLYERDHFKANKAPMKKVRRFVSPTVIDW